MAGSGALPAAGAAAAAQGGGRRGGGAGTAHRCDAAPGPRRTYRHRGQLRAAARDPGSAMTRDPLEALLRLRRMAADEARRGLAACRTEFTNRTVRVRQGRGSIGWHAVREAMSPHSDSKKAQTRRGRAMLHVFGCGSPLAAHAEGQRTNIRFMFQAMVTRLHSPRTRSSPRSRNCLNPSTDLMMPNTGSGTCLRSA